MGLCLPTHSRGRRDEENGTRPASPKRSPSGPSGSAPTPSGARIDTRVKRQTGIGFTYPAVPGPSPA